VLVIVCGKLDFSYTLSHSRCFHQNSPSKNILIKMSRTSLVIIKPKSFINPPHSSTTFPCRYSQFHGKFSKQNEFSLVIILVPGNCPFSDGSFADVAWLLTMKLEITSALIKFRFNAFTLFILRAWCKHNFDNDSRIFFLWKKVVTGFSPNIVEWCLNESDGKAEK
jgi:hypothetical protein